MKRGVSEATLACPKCASENVYPDGDNYVCADCAHEWSASAAADAEETAEPADDGVIRDVKGSTTLKQGTKISNIKLISGDHEIDCRVDNMGMLLKAQYVKKV
jgi:protein PhnA